MIGLMTQDQAMCSHRYGFTNLGERDGWMVSRHTPFSNDPETVITTWLKPMGGGYHARKHEVVLSRPYYVLEGGFPLGLWNDDFRTQEMDGGIAFVADGVSAIWTKAAVGIEFGVAASHPRTHMLAPLARYPRFMTRELCAAGKYMFESLFYFSSDTHAPLKTGFNRL